MISGKGTGMIELTKNELTQQIGMWKLFMELTNLNIRNHRNCLLCNCQIKMGWHCEDHPKEILALFLTGLATNSFKNKEFYKSKLFPQEYYNYINNMNDDHIINLDTCRYFIRDGVFRPHTFKINLLSV